MIPAQPTPHDPIAPLLTYRGFFGSEFHLPHEDLLDEIDAIVPYWFPLYDSATSLPSGALGAQQTDRGQVIAQEDCWLLSLLASASVAGASFVAQLYDTEREITFMDEDVFNVNAFGTALRQFFLKSPLHIPVGGQIESRIINLAAAPNAIQVIGFGVRPDMRKKIT
jgi:hypothetical protein